MTQKGVTNQSYKFTNTSEKGADNCFGTFFIYTLSTFGHTPIHAAHLPF